MSNVIYRFKFLKQNFKIQESKWRYKLSHETFCGSKTLLYKALAKPASSYRNELWTVLKTDESRIMASE